MCSYAWPLIIISSKAQRNLPFAGAFAAIVGTFIPPAGTGNNGEGVELLFPSATWTILVPLNGGRPFWKRF